MKILGDRKNLTDRLIWIFIALYICVFGYVSFLKFQSFSYYDWDFASDITVLWNSLHGEFLYYPFLEQNIFGAHLYLIIFLLIPVYAVFQHPLTLLFLQSIFLGLAAYPLYLLVRLKINGVFALAISAAYLLYPPLGYVNLFETHFEVYEIFFLFFAIYYFEKEDFRRFIIFIFLSIICKENVSLVVFMFGIYALLRKRAKRWILAPALLGIIWFFVSVKVVIPYFAKDVKLYQGGYMFSLYYQHLGTGIHNMARTIVMHPIAAAKYAFTQRKALYLLQLFGPLSFMPFLSPGALLIALPIFMQNLLSQARTHASVYFHYAALLIPFIFYSLVNGFNKLLAHKAIRNRQAVLLVIFFIIVISSGAYLRSPQFYFMDYIDSYRMDELAREKDRLVKMIPKDASVIATFQFLPKLAQRRRLYSMHFISTGFKMYTDVKYEPPKDLEYALIDFNEPLMLNSFFPPAAPENIRSFLINGNWRVIRALDDVALFKKDAKDGYNLCEITSSPKIGNIVDVNINNNIIFMGYDCLIDKGHKPARQWFGSQYSQSQNSDGRLMHMVYYWKVLDDMSRPLRLSIQLISQDSKIALQKSHMLGYRIFLPGKWKKGQIIKEHNYMLMPSDIEGGIYNARLRLTSGDNEVLPLFYKGNTDKREEIILSGIKI